MAERIDWRLLILMIPLYLAVGYGVFQLAFRLLAESPLTIKYQHSLFTDRPVKTITEANQYEIVEALPASTVWRYEERCLNKAIPAIKTEKWEAIIQGNKVTLESSGANRGIAGCDARSFETQVPKYPGDWTYSIHIDYPVAEGVIISHEFPKMYITVLSKPNF